MTDLRVQKLHMVDCETVVQRAYYDWGRGWPADAIDPPWDEADPACRQEVALRGYRLYDGWPIPQDGQLRALEAYVSVGINSRVILNDIVRLLVRSDQARPLLARIPNDARLETATDDQIAAAASLIELLAGAYHLGAGKVTKILHKKRPRFIPVFDSVVVDFLWKNFPHRLRGQAATVEVQLRLFREILIDVGAPLAQTLDALAVRGFGLTSVRLLDFMMWSGWIDRAFQPLVKVWETTTVGEARTAARSCWDTRVRWTPIPESPS